MENDDLNKTYQKFMYLMGLMRNQFLPGGLNGDPLLDRSKGQGRVLAILKIKHDITTKDLAFLMGIRQQSLNELLMRLENEGYVERTPSEQDKRVMVVHLTEKGNAFNQEVSDAGKNFSCLSDKELENLNNYLDKIINYMESEDIKMIGKPNDDFFKRMEKMRENISEEDFEKLKKARANFGGFGFLNNRGEGFFGGERFDSNESGSAPFGFGVNPNSEKNNPDKE
ncbi:MAG: MarR family winged helix-turn-helix transcriptional regulator [Eubacterium sp.]